MAQLKLQTAGVAYLQRIRKVKDLERTTITLSRLEAHLWESANILRGPVDAADFKTYIFPLLFFKRICDVWDEEYDEPVKDFGDPQLALFLESQFGSRSPRAAIGGRFARCRSTSAPPCNERYRRSRRPTQRCRPAQWNHPG
jgi:HsdM-like protein